MLELVLGNKRQHFENLDNCPIWGFESYRIWHKIGGRKARPLMRTLNMMCRGRNSAGRGESSRAFPNETR